MDLFRRCPSCGRRFHVKFTSRKLGSVRKESALTRPVVNPRGPGRYLAVSRLIDSQHITIAKAEFQYGYKCGNCGHEWNEKHIEEHRES